jgi:hypothetical protein
MWFIPSHVENIFCNRRRPFRITHNVILSLTKQNISGRFTYDAALELTVPVQDHDRSAVIRGTRHQKGAQHDIPHDRNSAQMVEGDL